MSEINRKSLVKKLQSGNKPFLILICGLAGTRKSSTAVKLGATLDFATVIGSDEIRVLMRLYDKSPIIQGKTYNRWQLFGPLNQKNYAKGFMAHSLVLKKGIMAIIETALSLGENAIIEGVHLVPSLYKKIPSARKFHFLLIPKDFSRHLRLLSYKFKRRHNIQKPWSEEKIRLHERMKKFLIKDARKNGTIIIQSSTPEKNCAAIIKYLKKNV
jgi:2-phosphoglycerate kinase